MTNNGNADLSAQIKCLQAQIKHGTQPRAGAAQPYGFPAATGSLPRPAAAPFLSGAPDFMAEARRYALEKDVPLYKAMQAVEGRSPGLHAAWKRKNGIPVHRG